jgi:hypothetical protein
MMSTRLRIGQAATLARGWPGPIHPVDLAYATLSKRKFSGGWGDEAILARFRPDVDAFAEAPAPLEVAFGPPQPAGAGRLQRDGTFASPVAALMPPEVAGGHVRHLYRPGVARRGAAVLLAGSGEEGYGLRTMIHAPLVDQGIELWLLEAPYYGQRRARGQAGAEVALLSEQAVMNLGMVAEARALLLTLRAAQGGPLAVGGYSMGAYMSVLAGVRTPFDVGIVALAGGDSARDVYTRSLLSLSIDFDALGGGDAEAARQRLGDFYHRTRASLSALPRRPDAAVVVGVHRDGYIPAAETFALHRHWPGSALRKVGGGHISAVVTERQALRAAVAESLARL